MTPAPQPAVTTISFATSSANKPYYETLAVAFHRANPDVRVQIVASDAVMRPLRGRPIEQALEERARAVAELADTSDYVSPLPALEAAYQLDLTPLLLADLTFAHDDFYPGVLDAARSGPHLRRLPVLVAVPALSYRRDLWDAAGNAPPDHATTWDDLIGAAERMVVREGATIARYGLLDPTGRLTLMGELAPLMAPGRPVNGALLFDTPDLQQALARIRKLSSDGTVYIERPRDAVSFETYAAMIRAGEVAIWPAALINPASLPFPVATLPVPSLPTFSAAVGWGYTISSGTRHPEASWRWIAFLSAQGPPPEIEGSDFAFSVPARRSLAERTFLPALDPDRRAALQTMLQRPLFASSETRRVLDALAFAPQALVDGRTPEEIIAAAARQYEATGQDAPQPTRPVPPVVVAPPQDAAPGAAALRFGWTLPRGDVIQTVIDQIAAGEIGAPVHVIVDTTSPATVDIGRLAEQTDCFAAQSPPTREQMALVLDLQPFLDADPRIPAADLPPATRAPLTIDGRLLGLPATVALPTLNYQPDLLAEAGYDPLPADATLTELQALIQALTPSRTPTPQFGYAALSPVVDLDWTLRRFGARLAHNSSAGLQPALTDPAVQEAVRWFLDILRTASPHRRLLRDPATTIDASGTEAIVQGQVGLWLSHPTQQDPPLSGAWRPLRSLAPVSAGLTSADLQVSGLYISAKTDQAMACWRLISALSARMPPLDDGYGAVLLPARQSIPATTATQAERDLVTAARQALAVARPADADLEGPARFWFYQAVDRALQGANLETELATAQTITEQYLRCIADGGLPETCARQVDPQYPGGLPASDTVVR